MIKTATGTQAAVAFSATDLVSDDDLSVADVHALLSVAEEIRAHRERYSSALAGQVLALLFEKPSLRTRVTFEVAMKSMGGDSVFIDCRGEPIGQREPIADVARNLDRWVQAITARTFRQSTVADLAASAKVPVINALSDKLHPCQALADVLTLKDVYGGLRGIELAYVGDGNNVAHSLLLTGAKVGLHISIATPLSHGPDPAIVGLATKLAGENGGSVSVGNDPFEAVSGAHAVYTDVWTSMGSEHEAEMRRARFEPYRVTQKLLGAARPEAIFLHCLPAHRGEEVDDAVMECPQSAVFNQAENRLHAQKALLWLLLAR